MPKYAIIQNTTVLNVIIADSLPTIPGRTVVDVTALTVGPGDSYNGSTFTPRVPSARETAYSGAAALLQAAYPTVVQWAADAQATYDAATTGNRALTAAEQREFMRRMGVLMGYFGKLMLKFDLDS